VRSLPAAFRSHYAPGVALFVACLLLALLCFRDYGVSFDEPVQREIGVVSYQYVFKGNQQLHTYIEKDHGTGFEVPLIVAEVLAQKLFGLQDPGAVYAMRHLLTHLFFLCSVLCGYLLVYALFGSRWLACAAFLMLAFHPRLYAHSYLNTKDMPFLAMFLVSLWLAEGAFRRGKLAWFALLGAAVGYTISIRILGIVLVACFGMFFLLDLLLARRALQPGPADFRRTLRNAATFFVACGASLYATWPVLWAHPFSEFIADYKSLSHFRWDNLILFNGVLLKASQLPAVYLPEWIAISTPPIWLALGVAGLLGLAIGASRAPLRYLANTRERNFLLYAMCLVLPIASVLMLGSIVYDDWRHVYFTYPSLVLLGLFAFDRLQRSLAKWPINALWWTQGVLVAAFMLNNHPFQFVYFNSLVSHASQSLRLQFDRDYWGTAYKQALEHLVNVDKRPQITIRYSYPVENNVVMLKPEDRKRIRFVDSDTQPFDYFLTGFRGHPADFPFPAVVHDISVQNSSVVRIYATSPQLAIRQATGRDAGGL
jgi:hypothetical protein